MRKLLLTLLFVVPIHGYSQKDPCKGITTETNEFTGSTSKVSKPVFNVFYQISFAKIAKGDSVLTALGIGLNTRESDYKGAGVYLKLQDGTVISRPDQSINCDWQDVEKYTLSGYIPLTDSELAQLAVSPVVLVQVGTGKTQVESAHGGKLLGYANCLKEK